MSNVILILNCQQQAQDEAWFAFLANVPMSWLKGVSL
jgi:hypothetical protein